MILFDDTNHIIVDDDDNVLFAPPVEVVAVSQYYYGVVVSGTRPTLSDLSGLTMVEQSSNIPQHQVTYPEIVGWLVFAEPLKNYLRTEWFVSDGNFGNIGGSYEDFDPNLFHTPTQILHEGRIYRLYISSYQTLLSSPIIFKS